ncbi:restriction endonuclease subunit S [Neiella marina]|uniref:Restriction endonuclease subunit S n=1 Tax=Neiella holothuriorum TaxID=2870530 RepID=A0ABS7EIW8_9GAMM|nr:restriction endonuclease subunit S [Neiella holothuriorum]MBW8191828.1 restriction endonuclease subunit S [Neiella holothuriorum]
MVQDIVKTLLKGVASVKAGYSFRGKIPEDEHGEVWVIQVRDISADGQIMWDQLIRTTITGRKSPQLLELGDVLFIARGQKHLAASVKEVDRPVVCAPHFFHIRLSATAQVNPGFLAWQLNQQPAQRYFKQSAEGSAQMSIRREVLENVPLTFPELSKQHVIAELEACAIKEKAALQQLIDNRHKQLDAIAKDILQ